LDPTHYRCRAISAILRAGAAVLATRFPAVAVAARDILAGIVGRVWAAAVVRMGPVLVQPAPAVAPRGGAVDRTARGPFPLVAGTVAAVGAIGAIAKFLRMADAVATAAVTGADQNAASGVFTGVTDLVVA
jgi:hypothetical protein